MNAIRPALLEALEQLDDQQQQRVLAFVRSLSGGTPFSDWQQIVRDLAFSPEDLDEMVRIIEEEFEQVRGAVS